MQYREWSQHTKIKCVALCDTFHPANLRQIFDDTCDRFWKRGLNLFFVETIVFSAESNNYYFHVLFELVASIPDAQDGQISRFSYLNQCHLDRKCINSVCSIESAIYQRTSQDLSCILTMHLSHLTHRDVMKAWRSSKIGLNFSLLPVVSRKVRTIAAISAATERLFSWIGLIFI